MNKLTILTRYPEAGKTKTRLIPALGPRKAAEIHRRLTEMTVKTADALKKIIKSEIEIAYHGGTQALMEAWLGKNYRYTRQTEGNLGRKIESVVENNFKSGIEKNIIIGSDCPGLSAEILSEAFQKLDGRDLVLGPAEDGGYYALGLKKARPQLFRNISWGSEKVFDETMSIAEKLKLSVCLLPALSDVDRPEDLALLKTDNNER